MQTGGPAGPPVGVARLPRPAVSYADNRVFFTSYSAGSGKAVWCLEVTATTYAMCGIWTDFGVWVSSGGDVAASPILSNGLVFVSDKSAAASNLDAVTPSSGVVDLIWPVGGDGARDYVFPRFGTNEVFLSTANEVLSIDTVLKLAAGVVQSRDILGKCLCHCTILFSGSAECADCGGWRSIWLGREPGCRYV